LSRHYRILPFSFAGEDTTPAISAFITKLNIIIKMSHTLLKQLQSGRQHNGGKGGDSGAE